VIVDVERLVVTYGGRFRKRVRALDGLDLQVREGDFFALLGQNGAGKSTVIHALLGLVRPTSGRRRDGTLRDYCCRVLLFRNHVVAAAAPAIARTISAILR